MVLEERESSRVDTKANKRLASEAAGWWIRQACLSHHLDLLPILISKYLSKSTEITTNSGTAMLYRLGGWNKCADLEAEGIHRHRRHWGGWLEQPRWLRGFGLHRHWLGFVADYTGFGLLAGESCSWWWKTSSLLPNNSLRPDLDLVSPLNL